MKTKFLVRRLVFYGAVAALAIGLVAGLRVLPGSLATHVFRPGLRTLDGYPVSSLSEISQEPIIVMVYWDVNCPYCKNEIDMLTQHAADLEQMGVQVVLVDVGDSEAAVRAYLEKNHVARSFVVLIGEAQPPANGLPVTVVIAEVAPGQWEAVGQAVGEVSWSTLVQALAVAADTLP